MAQEIIVVEGPNWFRSAFVRRRDIKYGWRKYHPVAIAVVQSTGGTAGSVVGGALIGGLLLGGVGAIVGGLAGGRDGRTSFVVETLEGRQLVCQCPANLYPGVYVAISKMVTRNAPARPLDGPVATATISTVTEPAPVPPAVTRRRPGCLGWLVRIVVGALLLLVLLAVILASR